MNLIFNNNNNIYMSVNSGYLSLAILGTIILGVIGGGLYFTNKIDTFEKRTAPTSMSYKSISSEPSMFGGRKTHKKKHNNKKTRRI